MSPRPKLSSGGKRDDSGFTLVELLIVVAILPLVIGGISVALLAVFNNVDATSNRLTAASDNSVTSAAFVKDVQTANWITTKSLDVCGGPAGTLLLSLSPDATIVSTSNVVSYVEVANAGSSTTSSIYREACQLGGATVTRAIAHNAITASSSLSLTPTPANLNTQWVSAEGVQVTLSIVEPGSKSATNSYSLTAVPRTTGGSGISPTNGGGGGVTPVLPVEIVGSCSSGGISLGGSNTTLNVGNNGTGVIGFTGSSSCVSGSPPATVNSAKPYQTGATNPFTSLSAPTNPTGYSASTGCTTGTPIMCPTGSYSATTPNFSGGNFSGASVTFQPSPNPEVFVFTVPVTFTNSTVMFNGSTDVKNVVYWFTQGVTFTKSNVTFGSATYIVGGASGNALSIDAHSTISAPQSSGMLFYVPTGTATVSLSSGTTGTISGSSDYDEIALWDNSSGALTLSGNGGANPPVVQYGGIYDPNGLVSTTGGYTIDALFLVVNSLQLAGGVTGNVDVSG